MNTSFSDKLHALLSAETIAALESKNSERMASLIALLARSTGIAISVAVNGNPDLIDKLVTGTENAIHDAAVQASITKLFESTKHDG